MSEEEVLRLFKINSMFNVTWKFKIYEGWRKKLTDKNFKQLCIYWNTLVQLLIHEHFEIIHIVNFSQVNFCVFKAETFPIILGFIPFWEHIMQTGCRKNGLRLHQEEHPTDFHSRKHNIPENFSFCGNSYSQHATHRLHMHVSTIKIMLM